MLKNQNRNSSKLNQFQKLKLDCIDKSSEAIESNLNREESDEKILKIEAKVGDWKKLKNIGNISEATESKNEVEKLTRPPMKMTMIWRNLSRKKLI